MKHSEKAVNLFLSGASCSQAVFTAFGDITGFDDKTSLRLASSFGGGIGRLRETCGACLGMCMTAGMILGYDNITDGEIKAKHYERIQSMVGEFKSQNGSIICRDILGEEGNDSSPTPGKRTEEYYGKRKCCVECVRTASEILDKYINE